MLRSEKFVWAWVWAACLVTVSTAIWGIASLSPELAYPLDRILCATADEPFAGPACKRIAAQPEAPASFRVSAYRRLIAMANTKGDADAAIRYIDEIVRLRAAEPLDYNQRGNYHFAAGRYSEAANDYIAAISAGGHDGVIWANLADAQRLLQKYDQAILNYTTAIRKGERNKDVLSGRGFVRIELGHLDSAKKDFDAALKLDPDDGYSLSKRGIVHDRQNRLDLALTDYDQAAQFATIDDVYYEELFANRGWVHYRQNRSDLARQDFEKSLAKNPAFGDALLGMAWLSLDNRNAGAALDYLARIPETDAASSLQFEPRSLAELQLDHWTLALVAAERGIENGSSSIWLYYYRGQARFYLRDYIGAYADFSTLLKAQPGHIDSLGWRAYASMGTGSITNALNDAEEMIRLEPRSPSGYRLKSLVAGEMGDYQTAIESGRAAVALDRNSGDLYTVLAYAFLDAKDYATALAHCETALAIGPAEDGEYLCRGYMRLELGQYAAAMDDAEQVIRMNPSRGGGFFLRGRLKLKSQDFASALSDIDRAIDLYPLRSAEHFLYRGDAYRALGQEAKARGDYEYARRIDFGRYRGDIDSRFDVLARK